MISINTPRVKDVVKEFDKQTINGILFGVESIQGLRVILHHNGDDNEAKALCKRVISNMPVMRNMVVSVQIVDKNGKLL